MEYITLNKDGFADVSGWISCYVTDYNGEYIGQRDEYISATTGLPAGAYLDQPPAKTNGKAVVRGESGWEVIVDNRGKNAYSCETGAALTIDYIGDIREGFTLLAPVTQYDKWDGTSWVTDKASQKTALTAEATAMRDTLRATASSALTPLQYAVDLDDATEEETALLKKWKQYVVALNRINLSTAPDILWPEVPTT